MNRFLGGNNTFTLGTEYILDDVFGIGDAIAAQFHKSLCEADYEKFLEEEFKFGKVEDPNVDPKLPKEVFALFAGQAYFINYSKVKI